MNRLNFILISILFSCSSGENRKVFNAPSDTLIIGQYSKDIGYFTFEHKCYPIISITDNEGRSLPRTPERNQILLKKGQGFFAKLVGFKDKLKFYPLILKSDFIKIDSSNLETGYYKLGSVNDTVKVNLMLDCNNRSLYLWNIKHGVVERCDDQILISTEEFVLK